MAGNIKAHTDIFDDTGKAAGQAQEVLDAEKFKRVLCRERKRAERSGESLLLLLFDLTDILDREERAHAFAEGA